MWRLNVLGEAGLYDEHGNLNTKPGARAKRLALLVYLSVEGWARRDRRTRAKERAGEDRHVLHQLLWNTKQLNNVTMAVDDVNSDVETGLIINTDVGFAIDYDRLTCDANAFADAWSIANYVEVERLYRGPFLNSTELAKDEDRFRNWVLEKRRILTQQYTTAVQRLINQKNSSGKPEESVDYWRKLIRTDPDSREFTLGLIRGLHHTGRTPEAMKTGQEFQERLISGAIRRPDPEIAKEMEAMRARGPVAVPSREHDAPPDANRPDPSLKARPDPDADPGAGRSPDPSPQTQASQRIADTATEPGLRPPLRTKRSWMKVGIAAFIVLAIAFAGTMIARSRHAIFEITSPVAGDQVKPVDNVSAHVADTTAAVWAVVYPEGDQTCYVSGPFTIGSTGQPPMKIHFGEDIERDHHKAYEVRLLQNPVVPLTHGQRVPCWPRGDYAKNAVRVVRR
ncbi:MAG: hypothetical protein M3081_15250 [Gemmatimonadota bacterium]|nr:hypothetical protein [Gemmatimonadota bacterium]